MRAIVKKIAIALVLTIAIYLILFVYIESSKILRSAIIELSNGAKLTKPLIVRLVVPVFLSGGLTLFGVLGFFKAREKGRNPFIWAIICFYGNLYAYLILSYIVKDRK